MPACYPCKVLGQRPGGDGTSAGSGLGGAIFNARGTVTISNSYLVGYLAIGGAGDNGGHGGAGGDGGQGIVIGGARGAGGNAGNGGGGFGGGIYSAGGMVTVSDGTSFANNQAQGGNGGHGGNGGPPGGRWRRWRPGRLRLRRRPVPQRGQSGGSECEAHPSSDPSRRVSITAQQLQSKRHDALFQLEIAFSCVRLARDRLRVISPACVLPALPGAQ
jgi:hypothetical protein